MLLAGQCIAQACQDQYQHNGCTNCLYFDADALHAMPEDPYGEGACFCELHYPKELVNLHKTIALTPDSSAASPYAYRIAEGPIHTGKNSVRETVQQAKTRIRRLLHDTGIAPKTVLPLPLFIGRVQMLPIPAVTADDARTFLSLLQAHTEKRKGRENLPKASQEEQELLAHYLQLAFSIWARSTGYAARMVSIRHWHKLLLHALE